MAKFKRNNLQLKTNQKVQLGNNQESVIKYDGLKLKVTNDGGELSLDGNGILLNSGVSVNEFSNDPVLGTAANVVPTQNAIKSYVDTQIGLGIETGNYKMLTGDTTADIVFVQQQGSSYYSIGYSIINTVDNPPLLFVSGVFEKTVDGFKVMFSSPMDTDNYELSWIVTDALLGSSSSSSKSSSSRSSSNSSSSSTSSSSSSSSSRSSSSTSKSSSSFSEVTWVGTGWPYPPDQIEVTIGSRWIDANVPFAEDDVIRLIRVTPVSSSEISKVNFTETGETTASLTNRLNIFVRPNQKLQVLNAKPSYGNYYWSNAVYFEHGYSPYDFAQAFDNNVTFTEQAWTAYMDVTQQTGFSPAMEYNGEVFKTFTFINN
jgi:hypothetical protein